MSVKYKILSADKLKNFLSVASLIFLISQKIDEIIMEERYREKREYFKELLGL